MLTYSQTTGVLTRDGIILVEGCYAGRDESSETGTILGKNNPDLQGMHDIGPLPQGRYTISPLHTVPHLGPCMALSPAPDNEMWGRSGFFIHLDNPAHRGASSDGCIVAPSLPELDKIAYAVEAGDSQLEVIA